MSNKLNSNKPPPKRGLNRSTIKFKGSKIGRNEPCPCGSGKKFKKCHLLKGMRGVKV